MKLSIVVPTYNGSRFLERTVESARAQTFTDWELVIVDDGSTDHTPTLARALTAQDSRVRLVCQPHAGVGAARNRGLVESNPAAESVIFLDHDDVLERNALDLMAALLTARPRATAVSGLARIIDADGKLRDPGELEQWGRRRWGVHRNRLTPWPLHASTTFGVLAYKNCIYTLGQVLIRRAALMAAGPFDVELSPCDDWDLWLRLSQHGEIAFLDRVVLNWRTHEGKGSHQEAEIFAAQARVRRKLLSASQLTQEQRRLARQANALWARHVASRHLGRAREIWACGDLSHSLAQLGQAIACFMNGARGFPVTAPNFWPTVKELYYFACHTPSDIQEHLDTLRVLARRCRHVTELGTRAGVSTTALLAACPKVLVSYDVERLPQVALLERTAQVGGKTRFQFCHANALDAAIEETDLLFIDTWHVYEQLKRELALHATKVRKYLVLHDTTTFAETGESPGHRGLWPAVEEFLRDHPEWALTARLTHNNGLSVLTRSARGAAKSTPHPERTPGRRPRRPGVGEYEHD